ncbi:helix-turn-helix domain-containing protein [Alcaligenaceae bacterium]|nr:helix-turn-helix domain-containing protein [Alcaligenaceae bacterium]
MDTFETEESNAGPRTLRRGLLLLQTLQSGPDEGLTITALSRETGLQRPTIYRLLAALQDSGFAHQVAGSKRYSANRPVAAASIITTDRRVQIALPVMRKLAQQTGDAVFLVVREGYESVSLWREIGPYPVQILATYAGKRQPLGVGSGGMALLAKLDDVTVEEIINHNADSLEQYGGMTAREMRQLVKNTRSRGYSVVGNYAVRGALGVGCALCDTEGVPILSISATAITDRMPVARQKEIARLISQGLAAIAGKF